MTKRAGEGGKGNGDGDEGGGRQRGNGNGGKSDGNKDNGGRRAMGMATKRVMVMVMATRVGEGGGQQNGHWRWRQERWRWRQGWRAGNRIQGDGTGNDDMMARPILTTTFNVRGGRGKRPPLSWAPHSFVGGTTARFLPCRSVKFGIDNKSSSNPFSRT